MTRILFFKAHVSGYTRKDGTYVPPHEDSRQAKKPDTRRDHVDHHAESVGRKVDSTKNGEQSSRGAGGDARFSGSAADTINVDGVQRPTRNSEGRPIAATEEAVRNFWRWFGDSKVVDADGKPLVVNHGTWADFNTFDFGRLGEMTEANATDAMLADTARIGAWFSDRDVSGDIGAPRNMLVFLSIKKPKAYRSVEQVARAAKNAGGGAALRARLEAQGFDGIRVADEEFGGVSYVAFRPEQIKSATGNSGTFDPSNPDLNKSRSLGEPVLLLFKAFQPTMSAGYVPPTPAQAEAGNYLKPRIRWNGLEIAIENPAGSVRSGTDRNGRAWSITMAHPYGYIVGSMGVDGDPVDVYVGPDATAPMVYVVHQRRVGDWAAYDEDKAMIGFGSEDEARHAFLQHYTDPRFLGPITAMPVDEFVSKVRATRERPAMIKAVVVR